VDLYFGNSIDDIKKYLGVSVVKENIKDIFNKIIDLNILKHINKINFYLGLELAKKYNLLLTSNIELSNTLNINKKNYNHNLILNDTTIQNILSKI
jgi:hypothetical protein